jgi:hypothetical protein
MTLVRLKRGCHSEFAESRGVVAKRGSLPYRPGQRLMVKVRRLRSVDCVVGGYVEDASGLPAAPGKYQSASSSVCLNARLAAEGHWS